MHRRLPLPFLSALLVASTVLLGCGPAATSAPATSRPEPATPAVDPTAEALVERLGMAAALTGDARFGALAVHEDGERLVALTAPAAGGGIAAVTGAVWYSPAGDPFTVYLGEDGLPERAIVEGYIVLFANYGPGSVDVALIAPDGSYGITRGVPVDPAALSALRDGAQRPQVQVASLAGGAATTASLTLAEALRLASLGLSVAGCVTAAIFSGPLAPLLCAAAIVAAIRLLTPADNPALGATGTALGAIGCGLLDAGTCVSLVLDTTADVIDLGEQTLGGHGETIGEAEGALAAGPLPAGLDSALRQVARAAADRDGAPLQGLLPPGGVPWHNWSTAFGTVDAAGLGRLLGEIDPTQCYYLLRSDTAALVYLIGSRDGSWFGQYNMGIGNVLAVWLQASAGEWTIADVEAVDGSNPVRFLEELLPSARECPAFQP
jgi:hypothetical protein